MNVDWGVVASLIGIGVAIIQTWMGFLLKANEKRHDEHVRVQNSIQADINSRMEALRARDHDLSDRVHTINTMVQGKFLSREEFTKMMGDQTRLFSDAMSRLDQKIDRLRHHERREDD